MNNERIEQIMNSLDGMSRAEANPFLYTRIEQALKERTAENVRWFPKLAVVLGCFVVLNIASFSFMKSWNTTSTEQSTGVEAFAKEYGISNNDI